MYDDADRLQRLEFLWLNTISEVHAIERELRGQDYHGPAVKSLRRRQRELRSAADSIDHAIETMRKLVAGKGLQPDSDGV